MAPEVAESLAKAEAKAEHVKEMTAQLADRSGECESQ